MLAVLFLTAITITSCKKDTTNNPTTCSNGVLDGDETGIDCGGSCTACSTTPSCTNGIQDGTETGVDCGGSCTVCSGTTKTYYFKGEVNGVQVINEHNSVNPTASRSSFADTCLYGLGAFITAEDIFGTVENLFSLDFNGIYRGHCPSIDDTSIYNHLFDTGTYTLEAGPSGSIIRIGLMIDGVSYYSNDFGTQPSTSNFTIVESTPKPPANGDDAVKIKATFRCKLQSSTGAVIEIIGGETVIVIYDYD